MIEIDGGIHLSKENKECDINREVTLKEFGIEIIRFTNDEIINDIDNVIGQIRIKIKELKLTQID